MRLRHWIEGQVGLLRHRKSAPTLEELEQLLAEAKIVEARLTAAETVIAVLRKNVSTVFMGEDVLAALATYDRLKSVDITSSVVSCSPDGGL